MDLLVDLGSRRSNNPFIQGLIRDVVNSLPVLLKADVDPEEICPICLNTFEAVFEEEAEYVKEHKKALGLKETSNEGEEDLMLGLTKVAHCGHTFCRRDLVEWIRGFHGNCPTCRHPFLEIPPETDDESSDGGEYMPDEEDEQDDYYFDFTDYSEADALAPSEAEIMEMNETAQAREDVEGEIESLRQEHAIPEILSVDSEEEAPSDVDQGDGEESVSGEALEDEIAEHFREQMRRADILRGPRRELSFAERSDAEYPPHLAEEARVLAQEVEWRQQQLEEEAAAQREILRQLQEVAEQEEELASNFAGAVDDMEEEQGETEVTSDTLMDVYLSDSSSDLDYQPEDYMMTSESDSDSEVISSDFGIEELDYLDQLPEPVTIHDDSSNDSILGLAVSTNAKVAPSNDRAEHRSSADAAR